MRYVLALLAAVLVPCLASPASAQEWSDEQMEVWRNVETYWDVGTIEDLEDLVSYFHEDFLGWRSRDLFPTNKADRRLWLERFFETGEKQVLLILKPVGIKLHGNVAIVHYFYSETIRHTDGTEESDKGRWTDILVKQGNKWVMIADAGGAITDDD